MNILKIFCISSYFLNTEGKKRELWAQVCPRVSGSHLQSHSGGSSAWALRACQSWVPPQPLHRSYFQSHNDAAREAVCPPFILRTPGQRGCDLPKVTNFLRVTLRGIPRSWPSKLQPSPKAPGQKLPFGSLEVWSWVGPDGPSDDFWSMGLAGAWGRPFLRASSGQCWLRVHTPSRPQPGGGSRTDGI